VSPFQLHSQPSPEIYLQLQPSLFITSSTQNASLCRSSCGQLFGLLQPGRSAGWQPRLDKLPDLLSPDINLVIAGKDSPLAVDIRGIAAVKSYMKLKSYKKIPLNPILLNSSVLVLSRKHIESACRPRTKPPDCPKPPKKTKHKLEKNTQLKPSLYNALFTHIGVSLYSSSIEFN